MAVLYKKDKKRKPAYERTNHETKIALGLFILLAIFIWVVRAFF